MTTPTDDYPLTERYLLGDLPEEERDRLELRLLEDPHAFEKVEAAETELIDRYVRDDLTADQRLRFERNLLPSARISKRVALAHRLHRTIEDRRPERTVTPFAPPPRRATSPTRSAPVRLAWAATIFLALAAGALGVANLRLQDRLDRSEAARLAAVEAADLRGEELAAAADRTHGRTEELDRILVEQRDEIASLQERIERMDEAAAARAEEPETAKRPPVSASLFLAAATRSADGPEILSLSEVESGTGVELELDLDRLRPQGSLTATVERGTENLAVWREEDVEPVTFGKETMVRLVLPEQVLVPGSYRVRIFEEDPDGPVLVGDYYLTVQP